MNAPTMPDAASSACRTALEELRGFRAKIDAAILGLECLVGNQPTPRPVRVATPREPKDEEQGYHPISENSVAARVLGALKNGPQTAQQISESTQLQPHQVSQALSYHGTKGRCRFEPKSGLWSLA